MRCFDLSEWKRRQPRKTKGSKSNSFDTVEKVSREGEGYRKTRDHLKFYLRPSLFICRNVLVTLDGHDINRKLLEPCFTRRTLLYILWN